MPTKRQSQVTAALEALIPLAPLDDTLDIRALANRQHMRGLPVEKAIWLATVTHIRHVHTDYHALLADGYDRDTARHFVLDEINAKLEHWHSARRVDGSEPDQAG